MKKADITPVFKDTDRTLKSKYRPVSLLPIISKLFERVMSNQITVFIEAFLSQYLCGYRKGYSTQHALTLLVEKWKKALDNRGYAGAVLMDLSKAFETLDFELLIAKLHAYGFDDKSLKLIFSYLTDRWQRTKVDNKFSSWSELLQGVPQGSILGPLLFNIYLNDLFYFISDTDVCNYADDTSLYGGGLQGVSVSALRTTFRSFLRSPTIILEFLRLRQFLKYFSHFLLLHCILGSMSLIR